MLTIKLHQTSTNGGDEEGALHDVAPHAFFMDYRIRDVEDRYDPTTQGKVIETKSVVLADFNNALAPVLLEMHGRPVSDSVPYMPRIGNDKRGIPSLSAALRWLRKTHPDREDGIRVGELLVGWAKDHPRSWWTVTASSEAEAEILASRTLAQHVAESAHRDQRERLTLVELGGMLEYVATAAGGISERETHDPEHCPVKGEDVAEYVATEGARGTPPCRSCNAVVTGDAGEQLSDAILQPETRSPGHGGGGGTGRAKPDKPMRAGSVVDATVHDIKTRDKREVERWETNEAKAAASIPGGRRREGAFLAELERREQGRRPATGDAPKTTFAGVKLSAEVKRALVDDRPADAPTMGQMLEAAGRAILNGAKYQDVLEKINELGRPA